MIDKIAEKCVDVFDDMRWPGQTWENVFEDVAEVHSKEEAIEFIRQDITENGVKYILELAIEQEEEGLQKMCEDYEFVCSWVARYKEMWEAYE